MSEKNMPKEGADKGRKQGFWKGIGFLFPALIISIAGMITAIVTSEEIKANYEKMVFLEYLEYKEHEKEILTPYSLRDQLLPEAKGYLVESKIIHAVFDDPEKEDSYLRYSFYIKDIGVEVSGMVSSVSQEDYEKYNYISLGKKFWNTEYLNEKDFNVLKRRLKLLEAVAFPGQYQLWLRESKPGYQKLAGFKNSFVTPELFWSTELGEKFEQN